jgi:GNAT superfamily N-acetyltransferase
MRPFDTPKILENDIVKKQYNDYVMTLSQPLNETNFITALYEGQRVGEFNWDNEVPEGDYTAKTIWVSPEHQRNGIAQQMWLWAVEIANGSVPGVTAGIPQIGPDRTFEADAAAQSLGIEMPPRKTS